VTRIAGAIVVLAFAALANASSPPPIQFVMQPGGDVAAALPVSILSDRDVKRQLGSGLTTTFLIAARQRKTNQLTAARLEIRYDLWDEVWIVKRIEFDRKVEQTRITSREALEKWWRTPVRLLSTNAARIALEIDLTVLPFSAAEKEDARQWITKSGGVGTAGGGGAGLVDVLIGTTIDAKPITTYRWNVELSLR